MTVPSLGAEPVMLQEPTCVYKLIKFSVEGKEWSMIRSVTLQDLISEVLSTLS